MPDADGKLSRDFCTHLIMIIPGVRLRTSVYASPSLFFSPSKFKLLKLILRLNLPQYLHYVPLLKPCSLFISLSHRFLLQRSLNCSAYHPLNPACKILSLHPSLNPARWSSLNSYRILPIFQCRKECFPAPLRLLN